MTKYKLVILLMMAIIMTVSACSSKALPEPVLDEDNRQDLYEFESYWNYTWYNPLFPWDDKNLIAEYIKDHLDINIQWTTPAADASNTIEFMIANDIYPDSIVINRDVHYSSLIEAGALLPLEDYVNKYPGVKSAISNEVIELAKVDGHLYGIPSFSKNIDDQGGIGGYVINQKVYEDLGSPKLETLDDLYEYLKLVKNSEINVDGKNIVPLQFKKDFGLVSSGLLWAAFGDNRFGNEVHNYKVRAYGNDLNLVLEDDKFDDYIIYLNKLYREGLLNSDCYIETQEQVEAKLSKGQVAVYVSTDVVNQIAVANGRLKDKKSPYFYEIIEPLAAKGIDPKDVKTSSTNIMGWNVVCITKNAEDPEKIFEYLDWAISPEGTRVLAFGPEGYYWEGLDDEGYPVFKEGLEELEISHKLPVNQYIMPGNASYIDKSNEKLAATADSLSWEYEARTKVTYKHNIDETAYANIKPLFSSREGEISTSVDYYLNEQMMKMTTVARTDEEVLALLDETINEIYSRGFKIVEDYMTLQLQEYYKTREE